MDIILQGFILLLVGMTTVYIFLWVLVIVMNQSTKFVNKFNYILPDEEPKKRARPPAPTVKADNALVAVAIAGAVDQSR
jgi:sodium pump decarboxylase gamma subunit